MRNAWFFLVLLLVGCDGNGVERSAVFDAAQPPEQQPVEAPGHPPKILGVGLSLYEASFMEGDGHVAVSAQLEAEDEGLDIVTVRVEMSNGVNLSFDVSGLLNDISGTITTPEFDVATTEAGSLEIAFGLVDAAGDGSYSGGHYLFVKGDPYTWIERATGLPTALTSVAMKWNHALGWDWDPSSVVFVAVGDEGTIMTSEDGLTWTNEVSGTDVDLNYVTCGAEGFVLACYAVGDEGTVLRSV